MNPSTFSAWGRQNGPMRNSGRTGVVADAAFALSVAGSIRKPNSYWSVTSAEIAITLSAWDPTTLPDPPRRKESGFAPSVCAVRAVEPPNQGRPGMLSGHMISLCVMTVPNS